MTSSDERFWNIVEGWWREKSHIKVSFFARSFLARSFEAVVESFVRGDSVTFKKTDNGESFEPINLRGAEIRLASLPYPVEKAKGLDELEYGFIFNIMWEGDNESRCTLCEVRNFGRPV